MITIMMTKFILLIKPVTNQIPQTIKKQLLVECSHKQIIFSNFSTTDILYVPKIKKIGHNGSESIKTEIISSLNFKTTEDAAPFYKLPLSSLYRIQRVTRSDVRNGYCKNRLYYIASQIQCQPAQLSERLAKRTFVYDLSFDWLENTLKELIGKGVPSERIIRDLWVLKYHHKTVGTRLQKIKDMGIDNLFPWMVRCSPDVLSRYLKITQDTKSILGDTTTTQMYLANRLNITTDEVEELSSKLPALKTIRAIKVKHFMDFLTKEGFSIKDIASKAKVLSASPKTVKQRLDCLRKLGVTDINLNLLCRSKKDFMRICESLKAGKDCKLKMLHY